jgi:hypothetical protein
LSGPEGEASTSLLLLGRYDGDALLSMFREAGVLEALARRGFHDAEVELDPSRGPLLHIRLHASKDGVRHSLVDACLSELKLDASALGRMEAAGPSGLDLLVVYWLRAEDPTAEFDAGHPRLPLQDHPGLGVLKRAFQVAIRIAREMGKDGIAALPKYFHDAAIFYQSRLFLFLDPREQGRFEALLRDFGDLPLGEASLALVCDAVHDHAGALVRWQAGLQVMPLSAALVDVFHSSDWQEACTSALAAHSFRHERRP